MDAVKIYFTRLRPEAVIPSKRAEDAGYDVYACLESDWLELAPHETKPLPTGIASAFSADWYFHIGERGSTGAKGISKRAGVIDSGFRGEWFILLTNLNDVPLFFVKPEAETRLRETLGGREAVLYPTSKAIAQAMLLPVPRTEIEEISPEALAAMGSERGAGSLGSSNK